MALGTAYTATPVGFSITEIQVEADIQPGIPRFSIVGLPDRLIREAEQRLRSAFKNSGFSFPLGRITISLSPADIPKQGTGFDLAMAAALMRAAGHAPSQQGVGNKSWIFGGLSLAGKVLPYSHALSCLVEARKHSLAGCILPEKHRYEAAMVGEVGVICVSTLPDLQKALSSYVFSPIKDNIPFDPVIHPKHYLIDSIYGQIQAKRILEIALAGGHNLFFSGPPGSGKSALAQSAAELLPRLSGNQLWETARMHALAGEPYVLEEARPPLRRPHHNATLRSILGGGVPLKPGELSLAHGGVLFLDEFTLMRSEVREALRQPMQEREVRILRASVEYVYPAHALVIAAQNNCYCGYEGSGEPCKCTSAEIQAYAKIVSAPLLERFDLYCSLTPLSSSEWQVSDPACRGREMAKRIASCRVIQRKRWGEGKLNAYLTTRELAQAVILGKEEQEIMDKSVDRFHLSARSIQRILAVSLTIADLAGVDQPTIQHLQEALQYRCRISQN